MKTRHGLSLLEVLIAGAILVVVILIITGVFVTTDTAFRTELPIREAQVKTQRLVDEMAREIGEGDTSMVWTSAVQGESLPSGTFHALIFLSARNVSTGAFVTDAQTMQPVWQKAVAFVPIVNAQGEVEVRRYNFGAASFPNPIESNVPYIHTDANNVHLEWKTNPTGPVAAPPGTLTVRRSSGILKISPVTRLELAHATTTSSGGGSDPVLAGGPFNRDVWTLHVQVTVRVAKGTTTVRLSSAIQGRN